MNKKYTNNTSIDYSKLDYSKVIKSKMVLKSLTQEEIAKKIGIAKSNFNYKINRTKGLNFKLIEVLKIANLLEVTLDELFMHNDVTESVDKEMFI